MAEVATPNHYERAFESWLIENRIKYSPVDQHKRAELRRNKIKSFDFLLYPEDSKPLIAEVKGRKFSGTSLEKLTGLECWVTWEDVNGLTEWQEIFGQEYTAAFIFAYRFDKVDVDPGGRQVHDFNGQRYTFFVVGLDDYRSFMKVRSPKWHTVTLAAARFRECALPAEKIL